MAIADLTPGVLDVRMTQGNDLVLQIRFNEYTDGVRVGLLDLTGWTAWEANARAGTTIYPFTVDDSDQVNSIIQFTLAAAYVSQFTEATWDGKAIDAGGNAFTFSGGVIAAEKGVS